jgi:hypothetical protein
VDIVVIFVKYHINSLKMTFIVLTIPGSVWGASCVLAFLIQWESWAEGGEAAPQCHDWYVTDRGLEPRQCGLELFPLSITLLPCPYHITF